MQNKTSETKSQDRPASAKKIYSAPKLTTFGSVSSITQGGGTDAFADAVVMTRMRPGM